MSLKLRGQAFSFWFCAVFNTGSTSWSEMAAWASAIISASQSYRKEEGMKVRSLLLETHGACATRQAAKALGQEEEGTSSCQEG